MLASIRNAVLFLATLLLALTAGRAFWIWLGENPFDMSGQTYVEFFQQLDKRIAVPIAVTGVGGTILAGLSAALHRTDRRAFYLLSLACAFALVGDLVTILVNVPINNELATWNRRPYQRTIRTTYFGGGSGITFGSWLSPPRCA